MEFAGIKRKEIYSPNHVTNDTLLLLKITEQLEQLGHYVKIYEEAFVEVSQINEKFIFSMAQGKTGLTSLLSTEMKGDFIINKPSASLNCYRTEMIKILAEQNKIPFPGSIVLNTNENNTGVFRRFGNKKLWLKRGDVHAEHKEDVTLIYSEDEMLIILGEFKNRGIKQVVLQQHLPGDVIKFYGLAGTEFFHWYCVNGTDHTLFDISELRMLAFVSAKVLGLDIFGGDAIISPDRKIFIIDINDFPSFAPVRDEASKGIAQLIHKKALHYEQFSKDKNKIFQNYN